ncbi:hypothetical protein AB4379_18670, partial [Vibrio breoganii]
REIINGADLVDGSLVGEPEKATITGFIGEGGKTLDSLVITDTAGTAINAKDVEGFTFDSVTGKYTVPDIDVSGLLDGELT